MRHLEPERPRATRELRAFALTVGGAFVALALLLLWRERRLPAGVAAALGVALAVAGLLVPARLGGVYAAWMRLAVLLSRVTTPVLMAAIWFGVLTPIALVRRLAGRGTIGVPRDAATGWVRRDGDARRSDMRRQF